MGWVVSRSSCDLTVETDSHYIITLKMPRRRPNIIPIERWVVVRRKRAPPECPKLRLRRAATAWVEEFGNCPPPAVYSPPPAPVTPVATEGAAAGAGAPRRVELKCRGAKYLMKRKEERCEEGKALTLGELKALILRLKLYGTDLSIVKRSE